MVDEINSYDQKTKEQEKSLMETEEAVSQKVRIKDYKKTSLLKAVSLFEEFLRPLEKAERLKRIKENGK